MLKDTLFFAGEKYEPQDEKSQRCFHRWPTDGQDLQRVRISLPLLLYSSFLRDAVYACESVRGFRNEKGI